MPLDSTTGSMPDGVLIQVPRKFAELFAPHGRYRYKAWYGGRGSAKSHSIARGILVKAYERKRRILCAREYQSSIKDSVHKLLTDVIGSTGFAPWFDITRDAIRCTRTGSEIIFKGLHHNVQEIKSTEGIDLAWLEEAEVVSEESWQTLDPTIRKAESEIWITYNPMEEDSPTHVRCVGSADGSKPPLPMMFAQEVSWRDNKWWNAALEIQRAYMEQTDPEAYAWIWEGKTRRFSSAIIFKEKCEVVPFETPSYVERFFYGIDWGYANDPFVLIRCFIHERILYVDQEAAGYGVDLDELPQLMDSIPGARDWPIKADNARPETIDYEAGFGFNITAADKWPGSVEDGISFLKAFRKIVIHPRCKLLVQESRLYSYKKDRVTGEVLPIIVDRHNHAWDALRYSLVDYILAAGDLGTWHRLAEQLP